LIENRNFVFRLSFGLKLQYNAPCNLKDKAAHCYGVNGDVFSVLRAAFLGGRIEKRNSVMEKRPEPARAN